MSDIMASRVKHKEPTGLARDRDMVELTAADIAAERHWSRWKAWRWLVELERKYGEKVVKRRGKRVLYTTLQGLKLVAEPFPLEVDPRLDRRLIDVEAATEAHEQRINGLANDLIEFRRKANEWFKNHGNGGQ